MRDLVRLALVVMFAAACGDDTPGQNGNPGPPPPPAPPPGGGKLNKMQRIEDLVSEREKGSIRHQFKERDFAVDQNRDPFQSFIISPQQIGPEQRKSETGPRFCKDDKVQAQSYSVQELRLVGIVAEGIAHKALVMGGNVGYILKPGDCVGREKAVVKEINDDFLTMVGQPDANDPNRPQEQYEKTLHPKQIAMGSPEVGFTNDNLPTTQPGNNSIVAPPSQLRPPNGSTVQPPQPQQGSKIIVIPPRQQQQTYTPPTPPATITP
jgi:Tfp pilus assembly protein PilP